jgi:hypothetical protein
VADPLVRISGMLAMSIGQESQAPGRARLD